MPAVPGSLLEPVGDRFAAVLPDHPEVDPAHPLACHRRRIADRVAGVIMVIAERHTGGPLTRIRRTWLVTRRSSASG